MAHSRAKREIMAKSVKPKQMPERKLEKAEHSKDPLTRKRASLAETLRGFGRK